jgi:sugar phosphate isomerase/epimerase
MGDGFIDYPGFFKELRENGFSGSIAYEMCSPLLGGGGMENLDRCARRFLEYMNGLEAQISAFSNRRMSLKPE